MNKIDFNKQMESLIGVISNRPQLVLHCCCAPCASGVINRLEAFSILPFFYNPNIDTYDEYSLRARQMDKLFNNELQNNRNGNTNKVVIAAHNPDDFYGAVAGLEGEREGGKRCEECISLRLNKTAEFAAGIGAKWFCSTLSVSPHKNCDFINCIGEQAQRIYGVKYLPNDFKKRDGFLQSVINAQALNLYRQDYCGCKFSK